MAKFLGIRKIDLGEKGGRIYFQQHTNIDPAKVIQLIQAQSQIYKLDGNDKLRVMKELSDIEARIGFLEDLFNAISSQQAA